MRDAVLAVHDHADLAAWRRHGGYDVVVLPAGGRGRWAAAADALERLGPVRAVWLPAPDVRADADLVAVLLALHHELGTGLTQPALSTGSPAGSAAELQHTGLAVRFVDPVGLSAPVLSAAVLPAAATAMRAAADGGGLPELLHAALEAQGLTSAVADCVPVRRTASPAVPALVDGCHPGAAAMALATRWGVPVPRPPAVHGGLDSGFRHLARREALKRVLAGWPDGAMPLHADDRWRDVVEADLRALGGPLTTSTGALR